MLLDKQNLMSEAQAITADATSTNIIDLGDTKDHGPGEPLELLVQVVETFNNLTTMHVSVQTDGDSGWGSPVDLGNSGEIALASLVAGYTFKVSIPYDGLERYLGLHYDVTGTAPTAGKITAGIVPSREKSYS